MSKGHTAVDIGSVGQQLRFEDREEEQVPVIGLNR